MTIELPMTKEEIDIILGLLRQATTADDRTALMLAQLRLRLAEAKKREEEK